MKALITTLALAITVFFFSSCEKTTVQQTTSGKKPSLEEHEKTTYISISASVSYACGVLTPCGTPGTSISKLNKLSVNNTNQTSFPSLTYTFYKCTSPGSTETYTYLGQYTCSDYTSSYAVSALDNGAKILIFASDASVAGPGTSALYYDTSIPGITNYPSVGGPSTYIFATMGNYKGLSCDR